HDPRPRLTFPHDQINDHPNRRSHDQQLLLGPLRAEIKMVASCQSCQIKVPLIGTPTGAANEPMGVCGNCFTMTCGHHGHRDPSPRYVCIQCDVVLQASSAGWYRWQLGGAPGTSGGGQPNPPGGAPGSSGGGGSGGNSAPASAAAREIAVDLVRPYPPESPNATLVVRSFDEWLERRPFYRGLTDAIRPEIQGVIDGVNRKRGPRRDSVEYRAALDLWKSLDDPGMRLLAASFTLAQMLHLPASFLPSPLHRLSVALNIELSESLPDHSWVIGEWQSQARAEAPLEMEARAEADEWQ
ncbi:hypothetical protein ACFVZH_38640, partial [Streptomyces sp. NPDC059534]|uniref:hypothetical protein n=1 Tax=Streptomyces sp. NPDC059534 TaxID=3346859 RepID=UPI0036B7EE18